MTRSDAKKLAGLAVAVVLMGVFLTLFGTGPVRGVGLALSTLGAVTVGGAQWLVKEEKDA